MQIMIAGGGIGGLTAALSLHAAGFNDVCVYEAVETIEPLGVGLNLPPHAVRELSELGLADELAKIGVPTSELAYYDTSGELIWSEPRGTVAGYNWPQYSVHRGALQMLLLTTVRDRLGADNMRTGCAVSSLTFEAVDQPTVTIFDRAQNVEEVHVPGILIGADGIRSLTREKLWPNDSKLPWNGWVMWRGMTWAKPYLSGSSMVIIGDENQRAVAYPMSPTANSNGLVATNWILSHRSHNPGLTFGDWSQPADAEALLPSLIDWRFDWLDVHDLIAKSEMVYEYPMVDLEPLPCWTKGAVTLLGDACHAMYPFGSNGASQAILDARTLAYELATRDDPLQALRIYEDRRRPTTTEVQLANRRQASGVMERISEMARNQAHGEAADELKSVEAKYKKTAGFDAETLNNRPSLSVLPS